MSCQYLSTKLFTFKKRINEPTTKFETWPLWFRHQIDWNCSTWLEWRGLLLCRPPLHEGSNVRWSSVSEASCKIGTPMPVSAKKIERFTTIQYHGTPHGVNRTKKQKLFQKNLHWQKNDKYIFCWTCLFRSKNWQILRAVWAWKQVS